MLRMWALLLIATVAVGRAQDIFLPSAQAKTADRHGGSVPDLLRRGYPGRLTGSTHSEIAHKINEHLKRQQMILRPCQIFSYVELNSLVRTMWFFLKKEIAGMAVDARLKRLATLQEYDKLWSVDEMLRDPVEMVSVLDAKCADVLMLWAHHLTDAGRQALRGATWPLLPVHHEGRPHSIVVNTRYDEAFGCVSGHNMTASSTSDHKWPHWPKEFHYHAIGHGPFPYWIDGAAGSTAAMEVWYSEDLRSEKFYVASCSCQQLGQGTPCYHLMTGALPSPMAYLYKADLSYCCISEPQSGYRVKILAPVPSDFVNVFDYVGVEDFEGDFYKGTVKRYAMQQGVEPFWFLTTPEGLPVQQGEGVGRNIWHDYNQSSFDMGNIDSALFAVPEICKRPTTSHCDFH